MDTADHWRASYSKSPLPEHFPATYFQRCATSSPQLSPLGLKLSALCFPYPRLPVVTHNITCYPPCIPWEQLKGIRTEVWGRVLLLIQEKLSCPKGDPGKACLNTHCLA